MANVYGVTSGVLQTRYFPAIEPWSSTTTPSSTTIDNLISDVSISLDAVLLSHGIASVDIDSVGEPVAYGWLKDTLLLGAAARVGASGLIGGAVPESIKDYRAEFEARLKSLREDPDVWIPDAVSGETGSQVRSHVTELDLTNEREAVTDNSPIFSVNDDS